MNALAKELNAVLDTSVAGAFLSPAGRRMYFPKGIVAQSAEAGEKATRHNATVGLATSNGQPMHLSDIYNRFTPGAFKPSQIFNYAPGGGDKVLRALWKKEIIRKNPTLEGKLFSEPIVTAGLTHAISIAALLFVAPGDEVVCPDLFWDNYDLVFTDLVDGRLKLFRFFDEKGHVDTKAMKEALLSCKGDTCRLILNFPNNPTGYSPSKEAAQEIVSALKEVAATKKVLVITDDAYFGLFYEDETEKESLFAYLADADENIFVVKGDAATKEEMVWGFRIGFISYASKGFSSEVLDALSKKTLGAIRCTVSNCDRPGQTLLLDAMLNGANYESDREKTYSEMASRYQEMKRLLAPYANHPLLKPYPFNSGYFMAFDTTEHDAEALRKYLLEKYQIGVINIMGRTLRLAYCSVEKDKLADLIATLYKAVEELWGSR